MENKTFIETIRKVIKEAQENEYSIVVSLINNVKDIDFFCTFTAEYCDIVNLPDSKGNEREMFTIDSDKAVNQLYFPLDLFKDAIYDNIENSYIINIDENNILSISFG